MVILHILQYLLDNGFGTAIDIDLFFEDIPLGKNGIGIISRSGEAYINNRVTTQRFDIYCREDSAALAVDKLEKIRLFFADNYNNLCTLPIVPNVSTRQYKRVCITSLDGIENLGIDDNSRIVFRLAGEITFEKE